LLQLYIPRDLWSGLEKLMAVKLLHAKVEGGVDKLLKVQPFFFFLFSVGFNQRRKSKRESVFSPCDVVVRYRVPNFSFFCLRQTDPLKIYFIIFD
jgi:hypothetical protein